MGRFTPVTTSIPLSPRNIEAMSVGAPPNMSVSSSTPLPWDTARDRAFEFLAGHVNVVVPVYRSRRNVRNRADNHFGRGDELARQVSVRHNHSTHQPDRLSFSRMRINYFHFVFQRFYLAAFFRAGALFRMSRWTACASKPARRRRPASSFAIITERWRPPVQPIPTVR